MTLERFTRKQIVTADLEESVEQVAARMGDQHVGAVVVLDGGHPVGMVTDRDLALRVLGARRAPGTPVGAVMSQPLATVSIDAELDRAVSRMREVGVRRLPIVRRDGTLAGLIALDDVHVLLAGELSNTAEAILDNRGP